LSSLLYTVVEGGISAGGDEGMVIGPLGSGFGSGFDVVSMTVRFVRGREGGSNLAAAKLLESRGVVVGVVGASGGTMVPV